MMRSLFSGVSGLRNHQTKMDVIGNNIANVNTQGFKSSRTAFAEMFNQTIRAASGPTGSLGGLNPSQIGLGVTTRAIDVVFSQGATMVTGRALDVAIQGDAFLRVTAGQPGEEKVYYTRSGNMYMDATGLLTTATAEYISGIFLLPEVSPSGNPYMFLGSDGTASEDPAGGVLYGNGGATGYNGDAGLKQLQSENHETFFGVYDSTIKAYDQMGDKVGRIQIPQGFTNISIGQDGVISGIDQWGALVPIAMIMQTSFVNSAGLERVGDNLYVESSDSGIPVPGRPALDKQVGKFQSGALEMSNVDLSQEFTDMIITQRGFQANSRIITVSDTLLEELINLKR